MASSNMSGGVLFSGYGRGLSLLMNKKERAMREGQGWQLFRGHPSLALLGVDESIVP